MSRTWPADTAVTPERFREQIERLVAAGFHGTTLSEALTAPPAKCNLVVTFDDAHRSVLEHAAPILRELGVPATVFVPTDFPGTGRPMAWDGYDVWLGTEHERELSCMSWEEIRGLADEGWEIGSHTCSHPRLPEVTDDDELLRELRVSREICEERLGTPCRTLAYPYGAHDPRVVRAAREAGYALAVTMPREMSEPLPLQWPRIGVYNHDTGRRLRMRIWRRHHPAVDRAATRLRRLISR